MYSTASFGIKGSEGDKLNIALSCIDLPLHIGVREDDFYGSIGPFVSYNLGQKTTYEGESLDKVRFKKLNYGFGAIWGISAGKFRLELDMKYGLANIYDGAEDAPTFKTSAMSLNVGYVF